MNSNNLLLSIFEKISRWCLYLAVLLVPVFFFPATIFPVTFSKQILLLALAVVGFLSLVIYHIIKGKFIFPGKNINYLLLALVTFVLISAWLSGARGVSLWGITGGEVGTFINLLAFSLIFCLSAFVFGNEKNRKQLISFVLISAAVVAVFSTFQLSGLQLLPWQFTKTPAFNLIGTTNALSLYLGSVFVLALSLSYLGSFYKKRKIQLALMVLAVVLFIMGFLINFWVTFVGWLIMALFLLLIDYQVSSAIAFNKKVFLILGIMTVALLVILVRFNFLPISLPTFNIPGEVVPSMNASYQITKESWSNNLKNIFFGSGPATYQFQYATYKNATLNSGPLWNTRFSQGFSAFFTHLVENGALGVILWLGFFLSVIALALKSARKFLTKTKQGEEERLMFWGITLSVLFLFISLFLYTQNFTNYFMVFLFSGMLAGLMSARNNKYISIPMAGSLYRPLVVSVVVILIFLVVGISFYMRIQHYRAGIYFTKAISASGEDSLDKTEKHLLKALFLDNRNESYWRALSEVYLIKIKDIFDKQATGQSVEPEKLQKQFVGNLQSAIQAGQRAIGVNKINSANWLSLAGTYESVISVVDKADEQTFKTYEQAISLEPSNPAILTNFGRAYIVAGENELAIEKIEQAVSLKNNYAPARYWLAIAYQRSGRGQDALQQAKIAQQLAPEDNSVNQLVEELKIPKLEIGEDGQLKGAE